MNSQSLDLVIFQKKSLSAINYYQTPKNIYQMHIAPHIALYSFQSLNIYIKCISYFILSYFYLKSNVYVNFVFVIVPEEGNFVKMSKNVKKVNIHGGGQ
jgi:hypothetical protein